MSPLDMSVLCKDWAPTLRHREVVASMPLDKELALSLSLRTPDGCGARGCGVGRGDARTLILSANTYDTSLFELRFWDGRLRLNGGTNVGQESDPVVGADCFDFQVSFNPAQGGLAIVASWVMPSGERGVRSFAGNIGNLRLPEAGYYVLRLGAPEMFRDLTLLGWRVNATYDLSPTGPAGFVTTDAQTSRTASAIVAESPLDTLRLAIQSIDSWRKVAEGALEALEKGAPS